MLNNKGRPPGQDQRPLNKTSRKVDYTVVQENVKARAFNRNIVPPDYIPVGKIVHCRIEGKPRGNRSGRIFLRADGSGWLVNFCDGEGIEHFQPDRRFDATDYYARRQQIEAERTRREAAQQRQYEEAANRAQRLYNAAEPAMDDHPYLLQKGVWSHHGLRQWKGRLVVPVLDSKGKIQSLQFISPDGSKRFLSGGRLAGGRFTIGKVNPTGTVLIAEGYATAATLHTETSYPTIISFTASNLEHVAVSTTKAKYPRARLVVCGDNDHETEAKTGRNPGVEAANRAASACNGCVVIPPALPGCSDWNDVVRAGKGVSHE